MNIQELTKQQNKLMSIVAKEWITNFNRLEFNEDLAMEFVDFLYELSGNKKPIKVILDSPLALQEACNMNKESQVKSLMSQVEFQIDSKMKSQVRSLMSQVEFQIDSKMKSQVRSLMSQVKFQIDSQVRFQVEFQIESKIRSLRSQKLQYFQECIYGRCDDRSWVSLFDYFQRIGVKITNPLFEKYKNYMKAGLYSFIAQEGIAYISKPPVFLARDNRGRMHSTNDYAIRFGDGFALHYVNGVYFEPELFCKVFKDKTITYQEILTLKNSEQKAVAIKYAGEYLTFPKENIIDTYKTTWNKNHLQPIEYQLYDVKINNVDTRFIKVQWYEKEELLTTLLGVPVQEDTADCLGAIAWTFGMTKEEYILQQEA